MKGRLKRAADEASGDGIVIRLRDGTVKVFDTLTIQAEMFLTKVDLACGRSLKHSEVLEAVRAATPESKAAFEQQFGSIEMETHIVAPENEGGWVEERRLLEDGSTETIFHEGGTEETKRLRERLLEEARQQAGAF